jgi:hypothetical protein
MPTQTQNFLQSSKRFAGTVCLLSSDILNVLGFDFYIASTRRGRSLFTHFLLCIASSGYRLILSTQDVLTPYLVISFTLLSVSALELLMELEGNLQTIFYIHFEHFSNTVHSLGLWCLGRGQIIPFA